jgi:hypothetical protein
MWLIRVCWADAPEIEEEAQQEGGETTEMEIQ